MRQTFFFQKSKKKKKFFFKNQKKKKKFFFKNQKKFFFKNPKKIYMFYRVCSSCCKPFSMASSCLHHNISFITQKHINHDPRHFTNHQSAFLHHSYHHHSISPISPLSTILSPHLHMGSHHLLN